MNILLAPNAMKGALSAQQITVILQKSLRRKFPSAEIISTPIADGGNGTLECLMNILGGTVYIKEVTGPIPSMKVSARYGITKEHIAIIESAEAIGLHHIIPSAETIAQSTSRGIGELILATRKHNPKEIWIGLGGSATNDGGAGMARALGVGMRDIKGVSLPDGCISLLQLKNIIDFQFPIENRKLKILSDVTNPLLGKHGATYTYAAQKGAGNEQLPYLESALKNFADVVEANLGKEFRDIPGGGAAGGLGFGLLAFCNAEIVSGIDFILDAVNIEEKIRQCDVVITTEGRLDDQTLFGKGIAGIAERAKKFNKPVHAFVGRIQGDAEQLKSKLGVASLTQISPDGLPVVQAMRDASWLLADAIFHHIF